MPVPSKMADLFTLSASNSPAGSDAIGNSLDDYIRAQASIIRSTNALSSASIASAATTDLGTSDGEAVTVTGTTTITSLGTSVPGLKREVTFAAALIITNSASIVLTGGANITTVAGDIITFRSLGSGVWTQVASARLVGNVVANGSLNVNATDSTIAASGNNPAKGLIVASEVSGASAKAAYINLIRQSTFGVNFGLDNDNQLKVGGGSMGAVANRIVTEGLTAVSLPGSINTAGRVTGGGVTSTNSLLVNSSGVLPNLNIFDSVNGGQFRIQAANTGNFTFRMSATTSLEIVNNGYLAVISTLDNGGTWFATNFVASSDKAKKKRIKKRKARVDLADLLVFCEWLWKTTDVHGLGVIAQEVHKVAPEYVSVGSDGTLGVDKASLALECVIGLSARLRALEGK